MNPLWLLRGSRDAPGWGLLESEAREDKIDVLLFDRDAWALMRAPEAPSKYEGLAPMAAPDALFLDPQGRSVYVAGGQEVRDPREVLACLGQQAQDLLEKIGDPDTVLERMGRVF
jgi:hypothetical protein